MLGYSLSELAKGLRKGDFSSVELTRFFLERIEHHNTSLNAFITVTADDALRTATQADKQSYDQSRPLSGIPFAHKDLFCTHGVRTSCASKILDNFIAPYDATVTTKLKQCHMPMLGKTNMDEFAMGSSSETSFYGAVRNPWQENCVPGGSSGGSAAAVAAGLAPCATATDTGGSIRQPAAFCGITGIKPTYGRVSRHGMVAYASSLDQGGVLARNAEDCALLLRAIAGFDEKDSTSASRPVPDYLAGLGDDIKTLRIGVAQEYLSTQLAPQIADNVTQAIAVFKDLGCSIVDLSLPALDYAVAAYYIIASAECSSNLARYDGVRYGYRCEDAQDLSDMYTRSRAEGFGTETKRRILIGTYVLSAGYYDAYYLKAQKVRRLIRDDFAKALEKVDVLIAPVSPTTAFKIGEKISDPVTMYLSDIYTVAVNLAGLPAIALPSGFDNNKPMGIQLIGRHFDESTIFKLAHRYQQQTNWHNAMPEKYTRT
ncbi:MAG: Asp-tRNA(Asn)/Glu-tRNA(Gln) amidotransferase subunit GatA [Chromatiales bacterium]|nr:Asp-tRNA(Asn)/Glu-tRNA(Gln) amidotransferase subunit GatA [Chromatiales bacterium]